MTKGGAHGATVSKSALSKVKAILGNEGYSTVRGILRNGNWNVSEGKDGNVSFTRIRN